MNLRFLDAGQTVGYGCKLTGGGGYPDPLITQRNSSLDGNAAFRKPANTGCGAPEGRSDLAEIFHLLGAQLLCDRSYAQTD
jgi:hypothetical protein